MMHKSPAKMKLVMAKITNDADLLVYENDEFADDALMEPKVTVEVERNCTVERGVEAEGITSLLLCPLPPIEENGKDDAEAEAGVREGTESCRSDISAASAELEEEGEDGD